MRYIDWIAFAYRMRNIVRDIRIEIEAIFNLDIQARTEKMSTYLVEIDDALKFIIEANAENTVTNVLGAELFQEFLIELELSKVLILLATSNVNSKFMVELETIITKMKILASNPKFNFKLLARARDSLTRVASVKQLESLLEIHAEVYSGVLHEVMRMLEFNFDISVNTILANVIGIKLECISFLDVDISFETALGLIIEALELKAEFVSSAQLNEVKTKISKANAKFNLDIVAEVRKEIMRKLLDTYPTPLSSVLEMSIIDFYYIYE